MRFVEWEQQKKSINSSVEKINHLVLWSEVESVDRNKSIKTLHLIMDKNSILASEWFVLSFFSNKNQKKITSISGGKIWKSLIIK